MSTETGASQDTQLRGQSAGGSPGQQDDVQKRDAQDSSGVSSGEEGGGEDPSAELARMKAELQSLRDHSGNLESLRDLIEQDPDLKQRVLRKIQGHPSEGAPARGWTRVEKELAEFEDSPQTRALTGAIKAAFEEAVSEAVSRLEPEVRGVKAVVRGTQFDRALSRHGVSSELQESGPFAEVLREQRAKRSFRVLEQEDPDYAAQIVSDAWRARSGTRDQLAAERRRVEAARGAGLAKSAPRGSASAPTDQAKVRKGDLAGLRALFAKGLTREQIEIVD